MARLGCLKLKKSTTLALAAIHLLLIAPTPETALADQATSLGMPRAIPNFAAFILSPQSSNDLTAETAELFDALRQELSSWDKTWLKAATYETLSATVEAGLYTAFFGGSLVTVGGVFVLTFASSAMVYVGHEYVWNYFSPPHISSATPERITAKAATYRALSMVKSFTLGRILSGISDASDSVTFVFSVVALDTILYGAIEYSFETIFVDQRDLTSCMQLHTDMDDCRRFIPAELK